MKSGLQKKIDRISQAINNGTIAPSDIEKRTLRNATSGNRLSADELILIETLIEQLEEPRR
jgi:hypothetical protein